ncbi:MAG: pyridoxamine 5'-phosphate oxidase family protein [Bdellovibrio sp.]
MEEKETKSDYTEIDKLNDLIKGVKVAMLTTMTSDHHLHSAPLLTQDVDFEGVLWFLISKKSQQISEIKSDPYVNLTYAAGTKYISISGTAELENIPGRVEQLWRQAYLAWFPQGVRDSQIQLLKVNVERAEYWEGHSAPVSKVIEFVNTTTGAHVKLEKHGQINL